MLRKKNNQTWNPKGGEFVVACQLVDIDEITGGLPEGERPDSGNLEAKKAMAAISMDFIMGNPLDERKMAHLELLLPEEPVIPMFEEAERQQ